MQSVGAHVSIAAQGWAGPASGADPGSELRLLREKVAQLDLEAQTASALLELLGKLARADDVQLAALTLVNELQQYLGWQRVALGLCRGKRAGCRLTAISGMARFDRHAEIVRAFDAVFDECLLRNTRTAWPATGDLASHAMLAHQHLCTHTGLANVLSVPIRDQGECEGVLVLLGGELAKSEPLLRGCELLLGSCLRLVRRAEPGPVVRRWERIWKERRTWRGKAVAATVAVAALILAVPKSYTIKCDCLVQPETRRFVVAPFEGTLEKSLAKQGDVVKQGDVLAQLDGRELRWELAGLIAERNRFGKQRDAAMATQKTAEAQAARLEMERQDLKIQLLQHRTENLEVKSPVDGIVISGDLERAAGAPLTPGQTLFEVAPLASMVVEIAIPEQEVPHVRNGLGLSIAMDAYPGQTWPGVLAKIRPRSEIRDNENVFIAEIVLDNPAGVLRPGMNGRAKIFGDRHPLAWNLFHKPVEWLMRMLGW